MKRNPTSPRLRRTNGGFVGTLILIIAGLALLKYFFDWSIFDALESEKGRATVGYVKDVLIWLKNFIVSIFSR